jgi:class 3 adenylate cyclase/tetratricopeptide (TPR) repeat protein
MALTCPACGAASGEEARFCAACASPLVDAPFDRRERKVATALFADVVGSTALAEREDPEVVHALLGRAFRRAERELERHGGTLEKYIGDAILAVFGVPVAHEDDPERAVRAALAVQAQMDDLGRELAAEGRPRLALRIGVETGEVLVDLERVEGARHRMLTGDAVNTAARLEQAAEPGQVVVGPGTHEVTREQVEYLELPPREVKGKAGPVPAWRALRARPAPRGERVPLRLQARLVGRDEELDGLAHAFERVRLEGRPRLVSVVGPAGIGKSRLAHEFVERLRHLSGPVAVRRGRCISYGNASYSALAEAMKAECGVLDDDTPAAVEVKAAAALERLGGDRGLLPRLRALIGSAGDERFGREDLFDAWRRTLEAMARQAPLVLVLEDMHWADEGLLDFVEHVATWARGPILLLALGRPELLELRPAWGGRGRPGTTIALDPLSGRETEAMLEDLLAPRLPPDLTRVVLEAGDGNPLFCEEIVRMLVDREAVRVGKGGGWELAEPLDALKVPRSIQALLAARLDGLGGAEKALLQDAAVVGRTFWVGAVCRLSGLGEEQVRSTLDRLAARDLVVARGRSSLSGEDTYAFHHVLIRDVAYESLPKSLRAQKHVATAEWAEEQAGERSDEIAELLATHHLEALRWLDDLGEMNGRRRQVEHEGYRWAKVAGERARRLWQQREAVRWLRIALDLGARTGRDDGELAPIWESCAAASDGIATVSDVVGAWEEALVRYERVGSIADVGRVEAAIAHASASEDRGTATRLLACRAIDRLEPLGDSPDLAFALYVLGSHLLERGELDRAEPLLRRSSTTARSVGDRATQANAAIALGWTLHARRRGDETVRLFDEALAVARQAGDLSLLLDALEAVLSAAVEVTGDYARAEALDLEAIDVAQRAGNLQKLGRAQLNLGYLYREVGRLDEVDAPLRAARDAATAVDSMKDVAWTHAVSALAECMRGNLGAARDGILAFRASLERVDITSVPYVEEVTGTIGGYIAMGEGRDEEAARVLVDAHSSIRAERLSVWFGQLLLFECARAAARVDRAADARVARDRLAQLASCNVPPRAFLAWADGLLEQDPARSLERLAEAAARFETLGRRIDLGRCLLDLATAEERLDRDGQPPALRGRAILESCGARLFLPDFRPRQAAQSLPEATSDRVTHPGEGAP